MASTGINEGRLVYLAVGGSVITHSTGLSVSTATGTIDITTKDSANDAEFLAGIRNATASGTFLFAENATYGYTALAAIQHSASNSVTLRLTSGVTGDKYYEWTAIITNMTNTANNGEAQSCDISFQMTGAVTIGTEA